MAENEILGIGAHMDISDIQRAINEIIGGLDNIGVKTENLSRRMNDAMNEIARSSDDSATKQKRAFEVLEQGVAEVKQALANYPEQLHKAKNEAEETARATEKMEQRLTALNQKLKETEEGSKAYSKLSKTIAETEQQISSNNLTREHQLLDIEKMEAGYNGLVSLLGTATTATGANAVAHGTVATATAAEAAQHGVNAEKIAEETNALNSSSDALLKVSDAMEEKYDPSESLRKYNEELDVVKQKIENVKKGTQEWFDLRQEQKRLEEQISQINNAYSSSKDNSITEKKEALNEEKKAVEEIAEEQKKTAETTKQTTNEELDAHRKIREELENKKRELADYRRVLAEINAERSNIRGIENPDSLWATISEPLWRIDPRNVFSGKSQDLDALNEKATEIKEKIKEAEAEEEELSRKFLESASNLTKVSEEQQGVNSKIEESKNATEDQKKTVQELIDTYRDAQAAYNELEKERKKLDDRSELNEKQQKQLDEINQKQLAHKKTIEECREQLEKMGVPYDELIKKTEKLNSEAKKTGDSFKGIFSDLKKGFSFSGSRIGGGGGNLMGMFSMLMSGGALGWASVIGVIAGGMKYLSDSAEKLKIALDPLKAYLDDDVLGKLRQSFIDTAIEGSIQSTEDMAAAALQWVKYYEGIRDVPEAIQAVVNASRQMATLTGKSAEQATKSLTKLAGQFHMTAYEATKTVDVLVNASHNSTVSLDELTSALASSGARVALNGSTFKEFAAAVSATTAQYGSASEAASNYQRILMRLSTETNKDFNPKVVGVTKAFQNLNKAMQNGEDLHKKFGNRLWSQAQYFVQNADSIANYADKLDDSTAKEKALRREEEKAENQKKRLMNATDALAASFNANLTPYLINVIENLHTLVTWLSNAASQVKSFVRDIDNAISNSIVGKLYDFVKGETLGMIDDITNIPLGPTGMLLPLLKSHKSDKDKQPQKVRDLFDERASEYRDKYNGWKAEDVASAVKNELVAKYNSGFYKGLSKEDFDKIIGAKVAEYVALNQAEIAGEKPDLDGNITDSNKQQEAEKRVKLEEDLAKRRRRHEREEAEQRKKAALTMEEAEIAGLEEGAEKRRRQIAFEHKRRLNEIERQKQQLLEKNIEYAATEYDKQRKPGQRGFFAQGLDKNIGLTEDQSKEIEAQQKIVAAENKQNLKQYYKDQREALYEYLKEYGSYQQQRETITKEYDEKIAEEQDVIQKDALRKQKERLISELNFKQLQESIDWEVVFGNLDRLSREKLDELKERLRDALNAKDVTPENAKVLSEKILEIESEISERSNVWQSLLPALKERERITRNIAELEREAENANSAYTGANLNKFQASLNAQNIIEQVTGKSLSETDLSKSKEDIMKMLGLDFTVDPDKYKQVEEALDNLTVATNDAATAEQKKTNAQLKLDAQKDILKGFKGQGIAGGISDIMSNAASAAGGGALGVLNVVGTNLNSMADFTDKIGLAGTHFGDAVHGFAEGVSGFQTAIQSLASGDIFGAIGGIIDGVAGFGKSITAIFGVDWSSGNAKEVAETTERLTRTNNHLADKIEALTEKLDNSYGADAIKTYEEGLEAQEELNRNLMEILRAQMGYHNAHHSNEYYADDNKIRGYNEQAQNAFKRAGVEATTIRGLESIYNLTPEQLKAIRDFAPELWDYLTTVGKYDKSEYWDAVVEQAGKTAEWTEKIKENLTTTTKENVFEEFLDSLYSMADGADDVFDNIADNWQKMVNKMVINNLVGTKFKENLEKWYEKLAQLNKEKSEKDSQMTDEEYRQKLDDLKQEYEEYAQQAKQDIESFRSAGIISATGSNNPDQQATYNSLEKWTYEQADELINRATAMQIIQEHIYEQQQAVMESNMSMAQSMAGIKESVSLISEGITMTIELHEAANSKLDRIVANTAPITEIRDLVKKIYNER